MNIDNYFYKFLVNIQLNVLYTSILDTNSTFIPFCPTPYFLPSSQICMTNRYTPITNRNDKFVCRLYKKVSLIFSLFDDDLFTFLYASSHCNLCNKTKTCKINNSENLPNA